MKTITVRKKRCVQFMEAKVAKNVNNKCTKTLWISGSSYMNLNVRCQHGLDAPLGIAKTKTL